MFYYLWYNNGTDWFDCASVHVTLAEAIAVAKSGWHIRQHITTDAAGAVVVWKNYKEKKK